MPVNVLTDCVEDLYNELRWLLCSAAEWDAEQRRAVSSPQPCFHIGVYAMDSALLHARSLYEFFTSTEGAIKRSAKNKEKKMRRLTWSDFGADCRQNSATYDKFRDPLHGRVMHLDWDRTGYEEVKKEVVTLARDLLRLWDVFCGKAEVASYAALLRQKREDAVSEARKVGEQYAGRGYQSPFA